MRPLILVRDWDLELDSCRLVVDKSGLAETQPPDPRMPARRRIDRFAISSIGSGSLTLQRCLILAPQAGGIEFMAESNPTDGTRSTLTLEDSLVAARTAVALESRTAGETPIRMDRTSLVSERAIHVPALEPPASLRIESSRAAIRSDVAIEGSRRLWSHHDDGLSRVRWEPRGPVLIDCERPVENNAGAPLPVDDPRALWALYWGEPPDEMRFERLDLERESWTDNPTGVVDWRAGEFALRTEGGHPVGADPSRIGPRHGEAAD